MEMQDIISEIKLELTGNLLDLELTDNDLIQIVNKGLREIERFWDETTLVTVPYASCIDLNNFNSSSVVKVYRPTGVGDFSTKEAFTDPLYAQQWAIFSGGGNMYNLQDYLLNYASWSSMQQIKNTLSTELSFKEDKHNKKLYINNASNITKAVTIEYIPKLTLVEEIQDEYWIDILIRMCSALTKISVGRIRTRFTQSNAIWSMDGDKILEEGNAEYKELREVLRQNSNMIYGVD